MLSTAIILMIVLSLAALTTLAAPPVIDSHTDELRPTVSADLPTDIIRQLAADPVDPARARIVLRFVRVDDETGDEGPSIFGTYTTTGDTLRFVPQFRLTPGAHYRAVVWLAGQELQRTNYLTKAAKDGEAARILKVYPTATTLPANLLKFYVHFSQPIRQTDHIFDQIHILEEAGQPVYDPWRRFQQWSDDGRRFTLWIHPGRVKQGVNLREDFGPVLKPDHKYTLVIDADVLDLAGHPIAAKFEKRFTAGAEDHDRPSLDTWQLTLPKPGTREPLLVKFPKPMDRALIQRLISVRGASDVAVEGRAEAGADETTWSFAPDRPWAIGSYTLHANDLLEDLAGNTPVRQFDADSQRPDTKPAVSSVRFAIK